MLMTILASFLHKLQVLGGIRMPFINRAIEVCYGEFSQQKLKRDATFVKPEAGFGYTTEVTMPF